MTDKTKPGRLDDIIANARKARADEFGDEPVKAQEDLDTEVDQEENGDSREQFSESTHYNDMGGEKSDDSPDEEDEHDDDQGDEGGEEESAGEEEDLVTIIVDGEQRQVPRSKVYEQGIRTMQKEAAADKRLAEANSRIKAAEEYEAKVRATQQQIEAQLRQQQTRSQDAPLSDKQDADIKQRARRIVDKLLDGDEEEATNALADILGRQQATPVDTNQLVNQVTAQVQRTTELRAAVSDFRTNYPTIANDDFLWSRADAESDRVQAEHPDWSPRDILLEAGARVEAWVKSLAGPADQDSDTQRREGKRDKKRTTETLPTASARAPKPADKRPPSRSEVVANMRKSRGLPL